MRATVIACLLTLTLAAPAVAQGDPDRPQIEGRNAWLNKAFTKVSEGASKHVVALQSLRGSDLGYGVIVSGGQILTCNGILPESGASVKAKAANGQTFTATISGRNTQNDIAMLRIVGGSAPVGMSLGSSKELIIGQFVGVIGISSAPLAVGVVSAKNRPVEPAKSQGNILMGLFSDGNSGPSRTYPSVVQHDAPLLPEHFGAPLVDGKGRLVGINVAAPYRGSSHAVGIDQIQSFLGQLEAAATRPWLGISAAEVEDELPTGYTFGLEVREVQAAGPGTKAGMLKGDVILAADGKKLASFDAFAELIGSKKPGDVVTFSVLRKNTVMVEVPVTLGAR